MPLLNQTSQYSYKLEKFSNHTKLFDLDVFGRDLSPLVELSHALNLNHTQIQTFRTKLNSYEIFGILFAVIYFLFGFPSNLLSIVICCRSLFQKFFLSLTNKRLRRKESYIFFKNINNQNNPNNFASQTPTNSKPEKKLVQSISIGTNILNNPILTKQFHDLNNNKLLAHDIRATRKSINDLDLIQLSKKESFKKLNRNLTEINFGDNESYKKKELNCSFSERHINLTLLEKNLVFKQQSKLVARSNPHRKCFELYLIELSVCDLIILTYNFIEWIFLLLSRKEIIPPHYMEPVLISSFMCRFIIALNRTIILLHNWLMASLAVTRCYAIYKPLNSTTNFSSKFYFRLNLIVFVSLLIIIVSVNFYGITLLSYSVKFVPMSFDHGYNASKIRLEPVAECRIGKEIYEKYKHIEAYVNVALGILGYSLPCFITLIINLVLIYNIRHIDMWKSGKFGINLKQKLIANKKGCAGGESGASKYSNNEELGVKHSPKTLKPSKKRNQFVKTTSSLLTLSFAYLICNIPYSFCFLFFSLNLVQMSETIIFVVTWIRYLNHSLNFYIYYSTGKRFRSDVKEFFKI